jgi:hypothetical protein
MGRGEMPSTQIKGLRDARLTTDGLALSFTLETDAADLALHVPTVDIGRIVAFFVGAASACDDLFGAAERPMPEHLDPVPALGIGFSTLGTPERTAMIVRLPGFDLAFAVESRRLADTARSLNSTLATLSASGHQPQ